MGLNELLSLFWTYPGITPPDELILVEEYRPIAPPSNFEIYAHKVSLLFLFQEYFAVRLFRFLFLHLLVFENALSSYTTSLMKDDILISLPASIKMGSIVARCDLWERQSARSGFIAKLEDSNHGARCELLQSHGGNFGWLRFNGLRAVLSGPAGGLVGFIRACFDVGIKNRA
jgi:hypothetical protein